MAFGELEHLILLEIMRLGNEAFAIRGVKSLTAALRPGDIGTQFVVFFGSCIVRAEMEHAPATLAGDTCAIQGYKGIVRREQHRG